MGHIKITEQELAWLMKEGCVKKGISIDIIRGIGWIGLKYEKGQPLPASIKLLVVKRGITTENTDGAGI